MKAFVDADVCTGCGLCASTCPEVFEMDGDVAKVKADEIPEDSVQCAKDAADDCPVQAIKVSGE